MDSVAPHSAFCRMEYCGRLWLARFLLPALIIALVITSQSSVAAMAPHLSAVEQDRALQAMARKSTSLQIYDLLERARVRRGIQMVNLTVVRRFLKGATHKRGAKETRDRKRIYSRRNVLTMNAARRKFIQATKGTKQVKWDLIVRKARVPRAHRTTAARAFAREKINVKLRRSREKPQRTEEQEKERTAMCGKMGRWPLMRFTNKLDMIMDCKLWNTPLTAEARSHLQKQQVVSQLQTPAEGIQKHFTKPSAKRHRKNFGGCVSVCVLEFQTARSCCGSTIRSGVARSRLSCTAGPS